MLPPHDEYSSSRAFYLRGVPRRYQSGGAAHSYGIQQPAVSSQILLLEADLGRKLFNRNPFRLTPEGEHCWPTSSPS